MGGHALSVSLVVSQSREDNERLLIMNAEKLGMRAHWKIVMHKAGEREYTDCVLKCDDCLSK